MQGSFKRGDFALPPSAREKKGKLLKSKMNMLIQESVWDSVDDIAAKKETFSPTADLGEILASSRDIADDISNANISEIDCNGFVVFGAGRPFIEIFYDETVCKLHQPTSQKAWLADASETSDQSKTKQDATTLLEQLSQSFWSTEDPVGYETAFSSEEHNNGRIVLKDDAFIHGYFYAQGEQNVFIIFSNRKNSIRRRLGKTRKETCSHQAKAAQMSDEIDTATLASIDVLISYKNGSMNLDEAVNQFCYLTGLSKDIGAKFIRSMSRSNIINLSCEDHGGLK